jgi:hypothetical protein
MPSEATRAWIYRVLTAAAPIATFYGYADEQVIALWLGLVATILGLGLAAANTSTKS